MGGGVGKHEAVAAAVAAAAQAAAEVAAAADAGTFTCRRKNSPREVILRLPGTESAPETIALSPFDLANMGRSIPMVWFYSEALDEEKLIASLRTALADYPVLCGRYAPADPAGAPPAAVRLCNAGVPVRICTVQGSAATATAHLPTVADAPPSFFATDAADPYLPPHAPGFLDGGDPDEPLLAVQISHLAAGGTALGVVVHHGVLDGEAQIGFVVNWSRAFRGWPPEPAPLHDRSAVERLPGAAPSPAEAAGADLERPPGFNVTRVPAGEVAVPAFAPVMHMIMGDRAVVVPISGGRCVSPQLPLYLPLI